MRKAAARTREALIEALGAAISAVTSQDALSFFEHCYRRLVQLLRNALSEPSRKSKEASPSAMVEFPRYHEHVFITHAPERFSGGSSQYGTDDAL